MASIAEGDRQPSAAQARGDVLLAAREVSKRYGGIQALDAVSVQFTAGSVHGLVGENGAGKSTLGRILTGVVRPDAGVVCVAGDEARYRSPRDALNVGVTLLAQELALLPRRTVEENVMLGAEDVTRGLLATRSMRHRYDALNDEVGFGLPADALVGELRLADQQKVEILRALARNARAIVMDEPTAALSGAEAEHLWRVVRRLRDQGRGIILISHDLEALLQVCDEITVLRNGRLVTTKAAANFTVPSLIQAMIGRALDRAFPEKRRPPANADVVLKVEHLSNARLRDVSLSVRRGEIVGLAGLIGSGRTELARAISGADRISEGRLELTGEASKFRSPRGAIDAGIAMIPESRKEQGFVLGASTQSNITLPHLRRFSRWGFVDRRAESRHSAEMLSKVGVRPSAAETAVGGLSGGNQQKVLFAKWLSSRPKLLIADEPTRGVDIPAKLALYRLLVDLAADGTAVLLISSEMEEVLGLSHRVLVMREGRIQGEIAADASEEQILRLAFGVPAEEAGSLTKGESR